MQHLILSDMIFEITLRNSVMIILKRRVRVIWNISVKLKKFYQRRYFSVCPQHSFFDIANYSLACSSQANH